MLGDANVTATLPAKDMEASKKFYEETLGLKKVDEVSGGAMYQSGNTRLYVYPSDYAGTNQATAAAWQEQDDLEGFVKDLKAKGVTFEHIDDMPGATREGDIHVFGPEEKAVWFKDPAGNTLCVATA